MGGRADGIFEYTVVTGDAVYSYVLKPTAERFATDHRNEEIRFPIRKWMKSLRQVTDASPGRCYALAVVAGFLYLTRDVLG
jgi:hypothetical protein